MTDQELPGMHDITMPRDESRELKLPAASGVPDTLREARARVLVERRQPDGIKCPCCDQKAKEYQRTIHASMAGGLRAFAELFSLRFGKAIDVLTTRQNADFAKLRYWHLIVEHPEKRGVWRVTRAGFQFLHGESTVPRRLWIYDGEVCGVVERDDRIGIADVLPFDRADIKRGEPA